MPAARSRTEHWRDSLRKVYERGGALEISVDRGSQADLATPEGTGADLDSGVDVVWRCKIVHMTEQSIVVENPAAFGASVPFFPGVALIGGLTVGQNRWMFHTKTLATRPGPRGDAVGSSLVLAMPENVERCTRRSFFRISTADLRLATVQCWPLLDPTSIAAAEAANRAHINDLLTTGGTPGVDPSQGSDALLLPEVGPMFKASLLNVSGGGLGLVVNQTDSSALNSRPYIWMRVDLRPQIPAPVAVTCRVAHTHIDSSQCIYAGLAFDFSHNPSHRKFVIERFCGYVEALQNRQRARLAA